jgi:hypothetical protein
LAVFESFIDFKKKINYPDICIYAVVLALKRGIGCCIEYAGEMWVDTSFRLFFIHGT